MQQPVVLPAVAIHNEEIILTGTTTDHDHDHQDQLQPQPVLESYHINSHVDAISTVEGDHEHDKISKFVDDNMEEQHDKILQQILLELDDVDDSSTESDDDDDQDQLQPQFALESRHMNYHGDAVNTVGDHHHDHDHEHDMSLGDNNVDLEQHDQIFMLHNPTTVSNINILDLSMDVRLKIIELHFVY